MEVDSNASINPLWIEATIRGLQENSSIEETRFVLRVLENLSSESIQQAPERWQEILHHVRQLPETERLRSIQIAAEILQQGNSSKRLERKEETSNPQTNLFENLQKNTFEQIAELLPPSDRAHLAQVNRQGRATIEVWRAQKIAEFLKDEELIHLLPFFCNTKLDELHPESFDKMQNELLEFVPEIIASIKNLNIFTPEQKASLCNHPLDEILQTPSLLRNLLTAAKNLSLLELMPFEIINSITNWDTLTFDEKVAVIKETLLDQNLQYPDLLIHTSSTKEIFCIPEEFCSLIKLKSLCLDNQKIRVIPPEITLLINLEDLHLDRNKISSLPPEIGKLESLNYLNLKSNQLKSLPPEIGNLKSLKVLGLDKNKLSFLPPEIGNLKILWRLSLVGNQLKSLPPEICNLRKLSRLFLKENPGITLPPGIKPRWWQYWRSKLTIEL